MGPYSVIIQLYGNMIKSKKKADTEFRADHEMPGPFFCFAPPENTWRWQPFFPTSLATTETKQKQMPYK